MYIMITNNEIDDFIQKIPPTPKVLKDTITLLNAGELQKAAQMAEKDLALKSYLKQIVNKPIYGFANEVSDIGQIFGILGLSLSTQTVYNYMVNLLSPAKWSVFKLNEQLFYTLQASLSKKWEQILKHLNIKDNNIYLAISLLPSSIIIADALFKTHIEDVKLLQETKALDYNTILFRLSNRSLFDICEKIVDIWEMNEVIKDLVQSSSGVKKSTNKDINHLAKWMHLLLFYELSQGIFVEAGLNDFIDFQIDFVSDIYDEFANIMEIS